MKKWLFFFIGVLLAVSAFAGGGGQGNTRGTAASAAKKYPSLPFATDGKTSISMLIPVGNYANITSYEYKDNAYTKELVDRTGVQIEFVTVPAADYATRRNLLISSGDYPDVLNGRVAYSEMAYWASEEIIIPLDDYHYMEYPNIKQAFTDYPALNTVLRLADNKVYALPNVDDAIWETYHPGRAWYYMPWIRDSKRKVPTTLSELTDYLRWIRDTDVNGNGNPNDEVPLAFQDVFRSTAYFAKSFMPFVMDGTGFGLALVNGKVTEQYRMNEYRDALKFMAGLYKEKLIKEDVYTWTRDQLKALSLNPDPALGMFIHAYAHDVTGAASPRLAENFVLPPMNGPSGKHWATNREPWGGTRAGWYVTSKSKDPELIVAIYDFMLTHEMFLNGSNQKGKSWDDPDPGALGLDGKPARYKRLVQEIQMPLNTLWYVQNATVLNQERRMGEQALGMDTVKRWLETGEPSLRDTAFQSSSFLLGGLIHWSQQDIQNNIPPEYYIPPVVLSDADNKRVGDIKAVLDPYLTQSIAEFVTGVKDINSDTAWRAYLADLDRLSSQERAAIYQKYQR